MNDVDTTRAANDRYVYETVEKIVAQAVREALDDLLEALPEKPDKYVRYNSDCVEGWRIMKDQITTTVQRLKDTKNE